MDELALNKFCEDNGFVAWFETSAKTDHKIDAASRFLVENILGHEEVFADKQKKRQDAAKSSALRPVVTPTAQQTTSEAGGCC